MGFEFFTDTGRGFRPKASIRKQGQIGLNHGAVKRYNLDSWEYVVLGFDREKMDLAIKKVDSREEPGAQKVVIKQGSATISARSFLEYFNIEYRDKTRQFDVLLDDGSGMLVMSLGKDNKKGAGASMDTISDTE